MLHLTEGNYCSWHISRGTREYECFVPVPLSLAEIHLTASNCIMLLAEGTHGERVCDEPGVRGYPLWCAILLHKLTWRNWARRRKSWAEPAAVLTALAACHSMRGDSHQRECSMLSTQVSLSDGRLQSEPGLQLCSCLPSECEKQRGFSHSFSQA